MKQKLLYIVPHLSTGGMPQYLLKQIESFKDNFDIHVIEFNNISDLYVVQKEKIKKEVKIFTLGEDKREILNLIQDTQPNIIHFQEIPEHFIDSEILKEIYKPDRDYFILVTTHSSLVLPEKLEFLADKFILVSKWSKQQFEKIGIDCDVWEYPIEENKKLTDKQVTEIKTNIGFDCLFDRGKHIINIGLFTPGKNQEEIFEIAKKDLDNRYHFIGNQAPNFEFYWGPLMQNKPSNCKVWGERNDVDNFYKAGDIFYFSSKFELNPLVVKEALSYNLPILMYKLPTYLDDYDNNPLIHFINDLTIKQKIDLINKL